jgi:hypothetical protein
MFLWVAAVETEANEFRKTGIYPLNHNVFVTNDFANYVEEEVKIVNRMLM